MQNLRTTISAGDDGTSNVPLTVGVDDEVVGESGSQMSFYANERSRRWIEGDREVPRDLREFTILFKGSEDVYGYLIMDWATIVVGVNIEAVRLDYPRTGPSFSPTDLGRLNVMVEIYHALTSDPVDWAEQFQNQMAETPQIFWREDISFGAIRYYDKPSSFQITEQSRLEELHVSQWAHAPSLLVGVVYYCESGALDLRVHYLGSPFNDSGDCDGWAFALQSAMFLFPGWQQFLNIYGG